MNNIIPIVLAGLMFIHFIILPIFCSVIAVIVFKKVRRIHKQNQEILEILKLKEVIVEDR